MRTRVLILMLILPVWQSSAQAPSPTSESPAIGTAHSSAKLDEHQAIIRERLIRLEDRLFQLNQALRKSEPEKASRLLETLSASRSMMLRQKMDEIIKKLQGGQYADALDREQIVTADLQALLKGLLEEPDHSADRKDEIEKLRALREALDGIIQEQKQERTQAAKSVEAQELENRIRAAKQRISALAQRQQDLLARGRQDGQSPDQLAAQQKDLAEQTQKVAESLTPPGESDQAFREAQAQVGKAVEQMESARDKLEKSQKEQAAEDQAAAVKALQAAMDALDGAAKSRLQTLEQQAAEQDKTADKTQKLSGDSQGDAESGEQAEGPKGQQGDQQPGGEQSGGEGSEAEQQEIPAKKSIKEAVPPQREAAESLRKKDAREALKQQDEALKKLQQAQDELEDRLEQLRKEQQEELLAALETRFRAMLAKQMECSQGTRRLEELTREKWKRTDQLALAELAATQRSIAEEADKALYILKEEGTTVVFPQIIEQVRDDARDAGDRIAEAVVGPPTRILQEGIEQALRELLDAIKRQQEENESGQGSGSGGEQGNPPLLPGSAELKLLRSCQIRVNKMTESIQARRDGDSTAKQIQNDLNKLSQRQQQVSEMARRMHESVTRPQ